MTMSINAQTRAEFERIGREFASTTLASGSLALYGVDQTVSDLKASFSESYGKHCAKNGRPIARSVRRALLRIALAAFHRELRMHHGDGKPANSEFCDRGAAQL